MHCGILAAGLLLATGTNVAAGPSQRTLTFEDRVKAQEAIERVYYSHQIGTATPFEQAVSRSILESKVYEYLDETAALKVYWKTEVTDMMLQRELERMAHGSRMPERLLELYAALGNDPFLIKECFARATLVDRLAREYYAADPVLHADSRRRAEHFYRRLSSGELSPLGIHPGRSEIEFRLTDDGGENSSRERLSPDEFQSQRANFPAVVGVLSAFMEERDAFRFAVVLSETATAVRVANYQVAKTSWDNWWNSTRQALRLVPTTAVAMGRNPLPLSTWGPSSTSFQCAADNAWDSVALNAPPTARYRHTAVWTGNLMVVWGGRDSFGDGSDTGFRYDPVTDTWTPTSMTGAPLGRYTHTAVWTGSLMVVWGGYNNGFYFDSGGRYDPMTDTWQATSTTGAPAARYRHTAIWTGSLMVVWGGYSTVGGGSYFDSGGRYDPVTDTWAPTSTTGAPAGRLAHTAVWAGSTMIIWGGFSNISPNYLSSGGRYDPLLNVWTPTSDVGAPSGRYFHTAVWTGSVMVIWGGTTDVDYLGTGNRYDPLTDTWTPTSTTSAPSARAGHTAIWTGSVMVAWGGGDSTTGFNSDGRYIPATDTWSPTSSVGSPSSRSTHTAIWTGSVMTIWGGYNSGPLNSGGRYVVVDAAVDHDGDGYSVCQGDCDDSNTAAHPGATELCNGLDDNCDGQIDEDASSVDSDGDGVHSACDNCRFASNPSQSDFDHDGEGDACDLNDGLIYVLGTDDRNYVEWQQEAGYTTWNSYRGSLAVLRATGQYTQAPGSNPLAARDCGLSDPWVLDLDIPAPGEVAFNLVTGVAGGVESGLGTNSAGTPRVNANPCPRLIVVDFNDRIDNAPLDGQYPAGLIDWGSGSWFVSGPWGQLTTNSVGFAGPGATSAGFSFVTPHRLISVVAYNAGAASCTVSLSCDGNPTRQWNVPVGQLVTITTDWTNACTNAVIGSSNGWNTSFDNLNIY